MTGNHASRDHATWSASASDRRWGCPGSLVMEQNAPPDKESHAAAWGTAAHEVAERALRSGGDCTDSLGDTVKTKEHEIDVDDEVAETAQVFVNYVRSQQTSATTLLIEQKFSLAALEPPFEAGGTGDAVLLDPARGLVEVVDLKGGRGIVVEALGNKQLRTYGLGALMANPGPWKRVKVTIVQPRAPHPDGRVRSEEFDVADLMEWTVDLLEAMQRAKRAMDCDVPEEFPDFLSAGQHCTFCRARSTCPALAREALAEAHTFFDADTGSVTPPPAPQELSPEQIARVLDHADMIQNWLNAVRAYAQDQVEAGHDVPGYVLVPKTARRTWQEELDEAQLVMALELRTDRSDSEFYQEPKLMSPAMVEKLLGKKGYEAVKDLVVQKSSGYNLARADKTTRGRAVRPAEQFFQIEGEK